MNKSAKQRLATQGPYDSSLLYRVVENTIEENGWTVAGGDEGMIDIYLEVPELKLGIQVKLSKNTPNVNSPPGYHLVSVVADQRLSERIKAELTRRAVEFASGEGGEA